MIETAIKTHIKNLVPPNKDSENASTNEELLEERFCSYPGEIDKIPDVVRYLREFDGNPNAFSSWKKSVDRVLHMYESARGTAKYYSILNVVRNKIVGNADVVLESYSTPLNWAAISKCLTLHYADKRDISTLEFQLMSSVQGRKTIEDFYQTVYQNLSLILNKVACFEIDSAAMSILTKTYRDKALDAFIRGLNGDLPRLLTIREPTDLPQALQLCLKLQNHRLSNTYPNPPYGPTNPHPQYLQQQSGGPLNHNQGRHQHQFYPQLAYLPQQPFHHGSKNFLQSAPQRPPKPVDRGEPMEVDPSIRTQRVNYMNRPNFNPNFKRPASERRNVNKRQRNFNINTCDETQLQEQSTGPNFDNQYADTQLQEYTQVHFLG